MACFKIFCNSNGLIGLCLLQRGHYLRHRSMISRARSSSSFEPFAVSFMQEDIYKTHCVSAHARFASIQLDLGHHDG